MKKSDFGTCPKAQIKPEELEKFGLKRVDNYFWLKDKTNPEVIDYIKEENAYTQNAMSTTKDLQEDIYNEIIGRMKEDDETYPELDNGYYYYSRMEKGKQYRIHCRKKDEPNAKEEIIFDINKMAEGKSAFIFTDYAVSPDSKKAVYFYNETGSFAEFTMKIRDFETGKDIGFEVEGATSSAWANDSETLFFATIDSTLRPCKIHRQKLSEEKSTVVYKEEDSKFACEVSDEKTRQFIMITSASKKTTEEFFISADKPMDEFKSLFPRVQDTKYFFYVHKDAFFIQYKDNDNLNSKVYTCAHADHANKSAWKEFFPHSEDIKIELIDVHHDFLALELRKNGLIEIQLKNIKDDSIQTIDFPEPVYKAILVDCPEYEETKIRYSYNSMNRPSTLYEYDSLTKKTEKLKEQEIPSGFNPDDYKVERLWATSHDGVKVPFAVVYKKDLKLDGSNPTLLYSYGSYGHSTDTRFISSFYSLVDRGFVFALAQIRGGSDLGAKWYEDGKLLNKKNTFHDFIACAEHLVAQKYTSSEKLAIMGGSAGGLLMGAVTNMRPDLFGAVVAQVPFVDVVSTMLDDSLPLTTGEYEEWGNPNEEEYYKYMLSYSPYDNIEKKDYPNMLVTGGLNDSQVLFHEPTKFVAKLRANKTDENILLLHIDMDSGHGGATGRYDSVKDTAFEFAFVIETLK